MAGRCELCGETVEPGTLADILEHLRLIHPEEYGDGPERWPDGGLVIVDESLTPDDFGPGGEHDGARVRDDGAARRRDRHRLRRVGLAGAATMTPPIRPENRGRYPTDWKSISLRIRKDRAGDRCECEGECGSRDHAWILRLVRVGAETSPRCPNLNGQPSVFGKGSTVVLTVAHLNHTPEDCDDDNLKAMCQSCHLNYDREHHAETRRATRQEALP